MSGFTVDTDGKAGKSDIIRTYPAFTRTGGQCAVCSAWRHPCASCLARNEAVSARAVRESLTGVDREIADGAALDIVRTGGLQDRIKRARGKMGIADAA